MADKSKRDFHHPYKPYSIQEDFMNAVYDCLDQGKVGVFESPTGTGKSLSLICGSLTWLRGYKRRKFEGESEPGHDDEPAWMVEHARQQRRRNAFQEHAEISKRLARIRQRGDKARMRYEAGSPPFKKQKQGHDPLMQDDDETAFILGDYESDDEAGEKAAKQASTSTSLSSETTALMNKLGMNIDMATGEEASEVEDELKIFFCSRTHSQLSQFANELSKVALPPSVPPDPGGSETTPKDPDELAEDVRYLTLGSRKNLCINPKVSKLGNASAITERCLELQQSGVSSDHKCSYLPNKDNEVLVSDFRDHALANIRDIEDLGALGKKIGICPYYATRAAVKPAEIVTLPYPLLLQKSARDASDLSIKGHVIIIDEAHNLVDAITNLHSVSISLDQLNVARANLGVYLQKFRNRLRGKNRVYITQLVRLIDSLSAFLELRFQSSKLDDDQVDVGDLLTGKGVDQINLYKLMRYLHESKLAHKVENYSLHVTSLSPVSSNGTIGLMAPQNSRTTMPVLMQVQSFILALTNPAAEGRFFYSKQSKQEEGKGGRNDALLRYLLLDPTQVFKDIVEEARAVILAGGTMSPMSDYTNHLFHYLPLDRISLLSCGHVIPPTNLLATPISKGPNGVEFEFSFQKRNSEAMVSLSYVKPGLVHDAETSPQIRELGRSILEFAKLIPQGVVIFLPSYAYLESVLQIWQTRSAKNDEVSSIWAQLSDEKRILVEPRSTHQKSQRREETDSVSPDAETRQDQGSKVDAVLADYSAHIKSGHGALLFAVMGGSLSEGINFSDGLGRGIAVVGLPYPNAQSPEWKAKLEYVEKRSRSSKGPRSSVDGASKEYYENVCMRAVNQSIGRAIRHKDDYAAILLLDKRYERDNIQAKLPGWIKASLSKGDSFWDATAAVTSFFTGKK